MITGTLLKILGIMLLIIVAVVLLLGIGTWRPAGYGAGRKNRYVQTFEPLRTQI